MSVDDYAAIIDERAGDYCRANGIRSLRLFGSRLHREGTESSDIDLLVEIEPGRSAGLFELSRMQIELSDLLGMSVDLRTRSELSPYFRAKVVAESRYIYGR